MNTHHRIEELMASDHGRALAEAWHQLKANLRLLRSWRPVRKAGAGIAAAAAAAVVASMNGIITATGAVAWNAVVLVAGSMLAGLIFGSYLDAPIGAEATVCDTRWPLIGLAGMVIASSTGQESPAAHLFTGVAPAVLAAFIQPAFALLSLALLGWALRNRLELERTAVTPSTGGDEGMCTTCRPLFPTKPGPSRGSST